MRKSFVSTVVMTIFVVYSLYQRTLGVQATADAGPSLSPGISGIASGASQGPGSAPTPVPIAPTASGPAQSAPSQRLPGSTPTEVPQATATATPTQQPGSPYRDGTYTGATADAFYGNLQVQATVAKGKLTSVQILQWPNDRSRSVRINQQALPWLAQEAIQVQSANVDVISGATDSSVAFAESLQSALGKAQNQ